MKKTRLIIAAAFSLALVVSSPTVYAQNDNSPNTEARDDDDDDMDYGWLGLIGLAGLLGLRKKDRDDRDERVRTGGSTSTVR